MMDIWTVWGNQTGCYHVSCHASELPFVFHSFFHNIFYWTPEELELSNTMVNYWGNFVHSGKSVSIVACVTVSPDVLICPPAVLLSWCVVWL